MIIKVNQATQLKDLKAGDIFYYISDTRTDKKLYGKVDPEILNNYCKSITTDTCVFIIDMKTFKLYTAFDFGTVKKVDNAILNIEY